jgi:hypothetical protein
MGKFEREAKYETAGILEAGMAILVWKIGRLGGCWFCFFLVFWSFFLSLVILHAAA